MAAGRVDEVGSSGDGVKAEGGREGRGRRERGREGGRVKRGREGGLREGGREG